MSRKRKSRFACWCEYAALRSACAVVNAVPYRLACALARVLARFAFTCGFHRRRTLDRIQSVFPEKDAPNAAGSPWSPSRTCCRAPWR